MRKLLLTLLFWLVPTIAFGQSTTVSGTVIDLDGQQWTAGTVVASFVPAQGTTLGQYTWSGGAFNPGASITISITAGGNYTQAIPSSTAIVPAGSKWTFTANSGTTSLNTQSQTVTVTGGSQTLNFAPAAIRITAAPGAVAYADAERSEEHTSELQSQSNLVCRLLLEKKKNKKKFFLFKTKKNKKNQ